MAIEFVAVVDGGASRTRCAILTRGGKQLSYAEAGASNYYGADSERTSQSLTEAVRAALKDAGLKSSDAACVSAGMASVSPNGNGATEIDLILSYLGFKRRIVRGDLVVAHAGAFDRGPGVIVIAGTGSSCFGISSQGKRLKIGGWGPVYSDEGSGYHIGRMALNAAAKAYDGYGQATSLVDLISQHLKISDFCQSLDWVFRGQPTARQLASLAEVVQKAATEGDAVATAIMVQAGEDLAAMAIYTLQKLLVDDPQAKVSYAGGILSSCDIVRETFITAIRRAMPNAEVIPPRYPPYIGAFLLACAELGWTVGHSLAINSDFQK